MVKLNVSRGPDEDYNQATIDAANDIMDADVWLIGTPIYNSFFSSALKNLFEYVNYKKTEGKVAGMTIFAWPNRIHRCSNPARQLLTLESLQNLKLFNDRINI